MIIDIFRAALGIGALVGIAYLFSVNRKKIDWSLVFKGLALQIIFALLVLKVPFVKDVFEWVSSLFVSILAFSDAGAEFVLGRWPNVTQVTDGLSNSVTTVGFIFAFKVLPTIIFFSALSSLLYYMGVLQRIVYAVAFVMSKVMKLTGAESLAAAANIFIGQTEAPLVVKPYLDRMSKSEIMCLMTGGMATIAGGVFAAYIGFLGGDDPEQQRLFATHLLSASIMSAPAAIVIAKILFPETRDDINQDLSVPIDKIGSNVLDAVSNGTTDGLKLAVNVGAMLLVFTAFMAMFNAISLEIGDWVGLNEKIKASSGGSYEGLTLQYVLGLVFAPIAWLLGVASSDILAVGQLLGEKTVLNEFFAYTSLSEMKNSGILVSEKSIIIATYALCGFANFASIGIQIGGISAIAPSQRKTLSELGVLALIGGTFAAFLTAAIAGVIV